MVRMVPSPWDRYQVDPHPIRYLNRNRWVYLGYDPGTGQHVAIKSNPAVQEAADEAAIMRRYGSHPHLITFLDFFVWEGRGHIVIERHIGQPLGYWRCGKPRPQSTAVGITLSVLEGLSYLHHHNILHTDVMPHNVMVYADDPRTVKLIDFDTAVEIDAAGQYAGIHKGGTTGFCPPEIQRGQWSVLDQSSDVFEAACLCTYLLTGEAPLDAAAVLSAVADARLRSVLSQAMHPDRSKRFLTCRDLATALSPFHAPS